MPSKETAQVKPVNPKLVGQWKKTSSAECDQPYPAQIEFFERPRFMGKKGPGQGFILWDAGDYKILSADQVQIQIATDELVTYQFSIDNGVLTFRDQAGCEFEYRSVQ